jgi:hypothetical protein
VTDLLARVARAFDDFDLAMDPILDEEQDRSVQAAISTGLAVRLVSYATGAQAAPAEGIALSLVRELTTMKRQMKQGMAQDQ